MTSLAFAAALLAGASVGPPQEAIHCREAHRFLTEERGMAAVTEPDTLDDWRTHERVVGCRVTAAGVTRRSAREEARDFYDRLRDDGWVRTPDPQDAPNEASLRLRKDGSDCLFNFYTGGILGTEAESVVDDAAVPGPGERRVNFLVLCRSESEAAR
jgi:hypothetical protein